ncbi:MAG: ribonuclease PH [Clostridiales bacterium]|nr:ribonuclease PH [Clostridiales bacterium]
MTRPDNRNPKEIRPCEIITDFVGTADGSCLIRCGGTRVICTASVEEGVPPFLRGQGLGWLTAEYSMLPASTGRRKARDGVKKDGRGVEISRLIGRALRQAVDRRFLGERTVTIDCDVLEADGGTRTASITGGFVALCCAVDKLIRQGKIKESPIVHQIAAVSAGIVNDTPCLDLCYLEDSAAQTDMNFVMNENGAFIELQGTGEGRAFSREELLSLLSLGENGIRKLHRLQREALGDRARHIAPKRVLVIASNNPHKIAEISDMVDDRMRVISMREAGFDADIDENGETFEENAVIKAQAVAKATGYCALGDDSGLSVDALDGAPGVHSARYCGYHGNDQANNELLIRNMEGVPVQDRTAQFICAMALALPNGQVTTVQGSCPGVITFTPRGAGGFGYDPYFEYLSGETFAEMAQEEKNRISHRAQALQAMMPYLEELSCGSGY